MPSPPSKVAAKVQDLPILLEKGKKGLLTVEDGRFDLLQMLKSGRRALFLRAHDCLCRKTGS